MELDPAVCERARLARDARFDGRFFTGVVTTGIYCRPVCPAPPPRADNVRYFPSAAAATEAGFRPCLRCRPESAPGSPAWRGTDSVLSRALRLMDQGVADDGMEALATRLGVTARHLRRLFQDTLGASPATVAATRRIQLAKRLVDETPLPFSEIAFAAGFRSIRRFNQAMHDIYGRPPRDLRRHSREERSAGAGALRLRLGFRPPYDWNALLGYLGPRGIPGVEEATCGRYRRTVRLNGRGAILEVTPVKGRHCLALTLHGLEEPTRLPGVVARVRHLFDLDAVPSEIADTLAADPTLAPRVAQRPGLRLAGTWDPFELGVRAILGQQISVAGATTLAGRLADRFGEPYAGADGGLTRIFPEPDNLADARLESIGLPRARASTLRAFAAAVADQSLNLDGRADAETTYRALCALPGIGDWTAQYLMLRGLGFPDAFPAGDLGLRKALGGGVAVPAREALARSRSWQPWRGYAAMYLWNVALT